MSFRHPVPGVNPADYERDISVKLHLKHERTDGRTDGQTPGIEFGAFFP